MDTAARLVANGVNPIFILLLLAAPWIPRRRAEGPALFWIASALGIGLATLIAEASKAHSFWPGHNSFPSGHETFALAASTSLVAYDARWLLLAAPLAAALGWALVVAGYHVPVDIAGSVLVGPPSVLLCRRVTELVLRSRRMP